jgi:hypothetical protein
MKYLKLLIVSLMAWLLVACGGGGGAAPFAVALYTTAPAAVSLSVAASSSYTVGGGTAPYTVSSGSAAVASVSVSGTTLSINGLTAGTAQITVLDATGKSVSTTVTVGDATAAAALWTTAPSAVTVGVAPAMTSYTIGGGTAPYLATSGNTAVVTASVNGTGLTLSGVSAGTAQVAVFDATGKSVSISVTVGAATSTVTAAALTVRAPTPLTFAAGTAATYTVAGGVAPYEARSGNTAVVVANIVNGNSLSIAGIAAGGPAQVQVFDAAGATASVAVTVATASSATALYSTAPSSVALDTAGTRTFTIGGGTGPYTATSSNESVAKATVTGSTLTVIGVAGGSAAGGNATISVRDAANATPLAIAVTVGSGHAMFTTAPDTVTLALGAAPTYTISGGSAPYAASSSNTAVATAAVSGSTLTISAVGAGSANVKVLDATNSLTPIAVTVSGGATIVTTPLFTTAPGTITIATGAAPSYTISGGTPPYLAASGNTSLVTAGVSGSTLNLVGLAAGNAAVSVRDAVGGIYPIAVTVTQVVTVPLAVMPSVSSANVGDVLNFAVSGGSAAYTVTVNNPNIATVTLVGSTLTANLRNVGSTTVAIVDSLGQSMTLSLTVISSTSAMRLSPSILQIGEDSTAAIALNIYGGTAPYKAYTSDLLLSSGAVSGSIYTVSTGTSATRCIRPLDSLGAYLPYGSYDITLTVVDSLGASATSVLTLKDNGKGGTGC